MLTGRKQVTLEVSARWWCVSLSHVTILGFNGDSAKKPFWWYLLHSGSMVSDVRLGSLVEQHHQCSCGSASASEAMMHKCR